MIGDGKLLTNAHCVEHDTQVYFPLLFYFPLFFFFFLTFFLDQVKVKRRGDDRKYVAKVSFCILHPYLLLCFYLLL